MHLLIENRWMLICSGNTSLSVPYILTKQFEGKMTITQRKTHLYLRFIQWFTCAHLDLQMALTSTCKEYLKTMLHPTIWFPSCCYFHRSHFDVASLSILCDIGGRDHVIQQEPTTQKRKREKTSWINLYQYTYYVNFVIVFNNRLISLLTSSSRETIHI